jgi:hypothetical protein
MTFEDIKLIDEYITETISDERLAFFKKRLIEDKVFKEEFEFVKNVIKSIRNLNREGLKAKINAAIKEYEGLKEKKIIPDIEEDLSLQTIKIIRGDDHRDYISIDDLIEDIKIEQEIYMFRNIEIPEHLTAIMEKLSQIKGEIRKDDLDRFTF